MPTVVRKRHEVDQHLLPASRCWIETCQLEEGYLIFDAVISPKAVFFKDRDNVKKTIYKTHLRKFDVLFRKLLRGFVGPSAGTAWSRPWHEILHDWKGAREKKMSVQWICGPSWQQVMVRTICLAIFGVSTLCFCLGGGSLTVSDGVVGQPIYGTLSSHVTRGLLLWYMSRENVASKPPYLHFHPTALRLTHFVFLVRCVMLLNHANTN